jgi:hypothetical protein
LCTYCTLKQLIKTANLKLDIIIIINVSVIVIFIIILLPAVPIIEVELLTLHVRLLSFPSVPFIVTVTLFLKYRFRKKVIKEPSMIVFSPVFQIRICIDLALPGPDPGERKLTKLTNKPDFQPYKVAFVHTSVAL